MQNIFICLNSELTPKCHDFLNDIAESFIASNKIMADHLKHYTLKEDPKTHMFFFEKRVKNFLLVAVPKQIGNPDFYYYFRFQKERKQSLNTYFMDIYPSISYYFFAESLLKKNFTNSYPFLTFKDNKVLDINTYHLLHKDAYTDILKETYGKKDYIEINHELHNVYEVYKLKTDCDISNDESIEEYSLLINLFSYYITKERKIKKDLFY